MTEWWRGAVVYQVYPRSFQDSDGDGIGDLKGITQRLGHIASLGVDAVWLSPVFKSPMADMGYDVSDYCDIDPLFGTLADFDTLVAQAHDLGLKVVIDQVISHSSDQHPYFAQSRRDRSNDKADWYVWADAQPDGSPPNNWVSVFGGSAWEWDTRRRQYYLHNFLPSQPDFNFHNPEVQDWVLSVLRFWLERGVDGFRLDTVNYYFHDQKLRNNGPEPRADNTPAVNPYDMQDHEFSKSRPENLAFLARLRALLDEYEARSMVGEVGDGPRRSLKIMEEYTSNGRLHMAYSFDMLGPLFTPEHFRSRVEGFFTAAPDGWPMWAFSNHDVIRHVTRWADHGTQDDVAKLAAAMLLSFEGSICLYQGEELGQTETDIEYHELTDPPGFRFWPDYKGRDGCRTPMVWDGSHTGGFTTGTPWLPVKGPQLDRNVLSQQGVAGSVLETYRALLDWRKGSALRAGRSRFFDLPAPLLGFRRDDAEGSVICLFNLSSDAQSVAVAELVAMDGPHAAAKLAKGMVQLGPNGWLWSRCAAQTEAG
ncbi:alpha-glucosidase [Gemmobacter fulvus]|uniref:Alpha-glucosidase n=1 Tax=Gemmobacter fulvus TaxID=2840474 RepID=A0A975PAG2_9RHOB|nr:alpha-amylase family glycosyl hydrolase [Gemmobacter fulvus]MBT9247276.1 alpha-glucosidase [Gemmobacter fulvus]QWK91801.1 alpha-glucosidase [Gemmobacter fulvus]